LAIARSHLDELAQWHDLTVQLRDTVMAQGRPMTPPITPWRSQVRVAASSHDYTAARPTPTPSVFIKLIDTDDKE
jgi:hypothetical protein